MFVIYYISMLIFSRDSDSSGIFLFLAKPLIKLQLESI